LSSPGNKVVLEKNPPKQGLKRRKDEVFVFCKCVLEKNPPKQGLKRGNRQVSRHSTESFREKSTKTRIETVEVWTRQDNILLF